MSAETLLKNARYTKTETEEGVIYSIDITLSNFYEVKKGPDQELPPILTMEKDIEQQLKATLLSQVYGKILYWTQIMQKYEEIQKLLETIYDDPPIIPKGEMLNMSSSMRDFCLAPKLLKQDVHWEVENV